ncbi:MAG: SMP-30/gluconolactonase/LRE family protein [Thaumarchaeota archaeon]|nr:SMP-30/gluconolactonase/LRE family protein [Nitrososphaerota archaeon]
MRRSHSLLTILVAALLFTQGASIVGASQGSGGSVKTSQFVSYRIIQHRLPLGSSQPWTITSDRSGNIWFVEQSSNQIAMYDPKADSFHEYQIPTKGALPQGIAIGADGSVWFVEVESSKLGILSKGSSQITEIPLPKSPAGLSCGPIGVTARGDAVWVTCEFSNQIDEYIPSSGAFSSYDLPVPYSAPLQVLFDNGGNFWFTAANAEMLGYATTSKLLNGTSNGIQEFAPVNQTYAYTFTSPLQPGPIVSSLRVPSQLAFSPDGRSLWLTEHAASSFDRYIISSGSLLKYWTSRPTNSLFPQTLPNGIVVDGRGIVWIAEHYGNAIARFDPVSEQLTEYKIPCCGASLATTLYLTLDSNGSVWFSEFTGNAIGELVPSPLVQGPSLSLSPGNATLNPDGTAKFTVSASLAVGAEPTVLSLAVSGMTPSGALSNVSAAFSNQALVLSPGTNASSTLTLFGRGVNPGTYYLTVGGRLVAENATESVILKLTVPGGQGGAQTALAYALVVGVAGSVAVVVILSYRKKKGPAYGRAAPSRLLRRPQS